MTTTAGTPAVTATAGASAVTATPSGLACGPARGLQKARAAYGAALVLIPGPVIWLATGQLPSRRARRVAQVLGIRHLVQAALTTIAPTPAVLAVGGQMDAVHTASMLMLAAVSRAGRRAALTDALTEAAFAAAGFSASGADVDQPQSLAGRTAPSPSALPRPTGRTISWLPSWRGLDHDGTALPPIPPLA